MNLYSALYMFWKLLPQLTAGVYETPQNHVLFKTKLKLIFFVRSQSESD